MINFCKFLFNYNIKMQNQIFYFSKIIRIILLIIEHSRISIHGILSVFLISMFCKNKDKTKHM